MRLHKEPYKNKQKYTTLTFRPVGKSVVRLFFVGLHSPVHLRRL